MYASQGELPMSGGDSVHQWSCEDPGITSNSYQLVVISAFPQQIFSLKLPTPKGGGSFALASITSGSHQLNTRSLSGPCFISCV